MTTTHPADQGDPPGPQPKRDFRERSAARIGQLIPGTIQGMLLLLLMVVLVPVLLVQASIHYSRFQERRAQVFESNLELARAVGAAFDAHMDDILRQDLGIGMSLTSSPPLSLQETNRLLSQVARAYPTVAYFSWVDPRGRVVASTLPEYVGVNLSDRPYFQAIAAGREWVVSDLLQARVTGEPAFAVARGARDASGTLQGVVVALVNPQRLGDVLGVQRAGQAVIAIIDSQGWGVYRYPEVPLTWEQRDWIDSPPVMRQALAGTEVTGSFVSPVDRQTRMSGLSPIRSIGWVAGASIPESQAMAPVVQGVIQDFGLLLLVAAGSFLVALIIARRITIPMSRLREHALAISRGELNRGVSVDGPTELNELAIAFNRMDKELQLRERRQGQLLNEVQQRAAELEDLLHTISHDLRTPLTGIQGHAQLLQRMMQKAGVGEREQRSAEAVIVSAQRMNAMIEDLVDSARLESGQLKLNLVPLRLGSFVLDLMDRFAGALETGRIRVELPESLPPVVADPNRLERILANLLGNALKYSPTESEVLIMAEEGADDVTVSVADQGTGIAAADLPHLFERFYRTKGARQAEGLGLGLYITRMMVEAHGGRIWVESKPGKGSTFSFSLRIER